MVTVTVHSDGGPTYDYASLALAEAGEASQSDDLTVDCYAFEDGTQCTWAGTPGGYTTLIQGASGNVHDGTRASLSSAYRMVGNQNAAQFELDDSGDQYDLTFRRIATKNVKGAKNTIALLDAASGSTVLLDQLLVYDGSIGVLLGIDGSTLTLRNSVLVGCDNTGVTLLSDTEATCENVTACANTSRGFYAFASGDVCNARNCAAFGNGTDFQGGANWDVLLTCASSDTTGSSGLQSISYSTSAGAYFTNVTAGSEDFNLNSTSSALYDTGTDLSGTFTNSILTAVSRSQWDINAYEYAVAAGSLPPFLRRQLRALLVR
jgi:hypothetical protein